MRDRRQLTCLFLLAALACGGSGSPLGNLDFDVGTIRIENHSSAALLEVNIARCEQTRWGANRIADHVIDPGQSREFELATDCYNVRAVTITGAEAHFSDLDLKGAMVLTLRILDG